MSPRKFIPYGRQLVDEDDIQEVIKVLHSDWITTGPVIDKFEKELAKVCGTSYAVAVSSGTSALHLIIAALGLGPGDEVIVPAITFVATSNAVVYLGARPVFADVCPSTLLIDPNSVKRLVTSKTKAIIAVDYGGQPCNYDELWNIAKEYDLWLISDACHSLGAQYFGRPVGSLAHLTAFSFHPVKIITTGEGGAVVTDDKVLSSRIKQLRNHGIDLEFRQRAKKNTWQYDMAALGFNFRISDINCALGLSQLRKLKRFIKRRNEIALKYNDSFKDLDFITPLTLHEGRLSAYHLYVVKLPSETERDLFFAFMRQKGIGVNVHYKPVYLHSYYLKRLGTKKGICPIAEREYKRIVSLPIFPGLKDAEQDYVIDSVFEYGKSRGL